MTPFVKVVEPGSYDFGEPIVQPVKVASSGLRGDDLKSFIKRAGHQFADALTKGAGIKPGDVPVHLIALGDKEHYGCFTAGTPIAMADGRNIPVEELKVDDLVLSADGNICPVSQLFKRDVEQTTRLNVCGLADDLVCSTDHPFRVARKEQFTCCHDKYVRCLPPSQGKQSICNRPAHNRDCTITGYPAIVWEWATASSVREGDFLIWTAPDLPVPIELSTEEGYLLGAWLAEGNFTRNAVNKAVVSIVLNIHVDEDKFLASLKRCTAALGLNLRSYVYDYEPNSRIISITGNPDRFRIWYTLFNEHSKSKRLPPWICCLPRSVRLAMLAGYLDGDGCCVIDQKENRTTARSAGCDLSLGIQRLCWSLGFPAVRCTTPGGHWNVSVANTYLEELSAWSWKISTRETKQIKIHGFYLDDRMYLPVRNVTTEGPATVYNFEVAGDHTYSGPGVDSHNCNRNFDSFPADCCDQCHNTFVKNAKWFHNHSNHPEDPYYGFIKMSVFNDRMHRIELLAILNGTKEAADRNGGRVASEEMDILDRGDDIPVSMSCRLLTDQCSACGNRAKSRDEYCRSPSQGGHCKAGGLHDNMGAYTGDPEDPILHAINPAPLTWFDMSKVVRPADRIAYTMGLVKAAEQLKRGGAALADYYGITAPLDLDATGLSAEMLRLARRLADLENELTKKASDRWYLAFDSQPDTTWHDHDGKLGDALQALAREQIMMPLSGFLQMVERGNGVKSAQAASVTKPLLPGLYNKLIKSGEIYSLVENNPFIPSEKLAPMAVRKWAEKKAADYSLSTQYADKRVLRASLYHDRLPSLTKSASNNTSGPSLELAKLYAAYQLAALSTMTENPKVDVGHLTRLTVLQNYS